MAIAPVLERKVNTTVTHSGENESYGYTRRTEDEIHNARIKDNWAKLISPDAKVSDIINKPEQNAQAASAPATNASYIMPTQQILNTQRVNNNVQQANDARQTNDSQPYLVQNARATADIFRADSAINIARRSATLNSVSDAANAEFEEEENENLRPTSTTIQYKTLDKYEKQTKAVKIETASLSKKEKITIASFIGIVVLLFALIIVNAVIISGLNAEVGMLENNLEAAQNIFQIISAEVAEVNSVENIIGYATENGMIFVGGN